MKVARLLIIISFLSFWSGVLCAQSCISTGINGTSIDLLCNQTCTNLHFQVPHLKSTSDYTIVSIPYTPYPYLSVTGSESPIIYADDQYGDKVTIPFSFCFYDSLFTKLTVGSNGLITFDTTNANCSNAYTITPAIPNPGGTQCSQFGIYYPKAAIMGAYSDLDPRTPTASPADRKIQWHVEGSAPCRKFVISFYHIGVYGSICGLNTPNTFQIVIHESTGIIEVFFEQKTCTSSTNNGRAILGIQNWNRDQAVAAPGKNATVWNENNTGYRFVPSGAGSRFVSCQLFTLSGTFVANGDTSTTTPGLLDIDFPSVCPPPGNSTTYVVKTNFSACDDPLNLLTSYDTLQINRTNSLNATATSTNSNCGGTTGTIIITVPPGVGTSPYTFQLDGGAPQTGTSPFTFNNVAGGNHTVVVTDASGGCSTSTHVFVAQNSTLDAVTTVTPASCPGINNGSITVTAPTGTAPFTFQLDGGPQQSGSNPYTFNNVSAGVHIIIVRDAGGCQSVPISVTVDAGLPVSASAGTTAASCPGVNNGTITVTPTSSIGPYTYSLDGGAFVPGGVPYTFTNVSSGPHTVVVKDVNGCISNTISVTVNAGVGVNANTSTSPTSCAGVNNGSITVTPTSGTGPYTFSLDGGAFVPGASPYTFNNLASGTHTIVVRDVNGCISNTLSVDVAVGSGVNANASAAPTSCPGVNNGTVTVTATTGTAPYTFSLDGGAFVPGANPVTFTNIPAGNHTVVVRDVNGCISATVSITVGVGSGIIASVNSSPTSCAGASNGSITVTPITGTAPFTYQLNAGPFQASNVFNGLATANYTVTIQDANGCSTTYNATVPQGSALTANLSSNPSSCLGATNGSITVTPTNGSAPYTFSLDGGAPQSGATPFTFNNVAPGNHNIVITEGAGCISSPFPATVSAGPALTTTVNKTDVLCNGGSTGTITVTVPVIGSAPYQYSLDGVTWQPGNTFNGLAANTYTVYYRESNGCQGSQSVTVNQPAILSASASAAAVVCNGQNNGIITIIPSGGTSPYQYSLNAGPYQAANTFNVAAGSYTITIKDNNNCTTTQPVTVTEPVVLTANTTTTNASCNGGNDGSITVTANGGNAGYQYSIDGINFQASNVFNVTAGNYTVTIKDNLGCTTTRNVSVGQSNNMTLTPQPDKTICEGKSIQLQIVSNATQYSWSPAAGLSNANISNPVANPTTTTQYIVTATLGNCSAKDTMIVNVNAAPIPDAGPDAVICFGQSYQLQGSGGVSFSWTPSNYLSSVSVSNPNVTPNSTITYSLSVTDANGCQSLITDQVKVDVTPPIVVSTSPKDTIVYTGDQFQVLANSIGNIYNWSPSFGLSDPNIPNPIVTGGAVGDIIVYKVTASTAAGCKGDGFVKVQVYKGPDIYVPTAFTPNNDGKNDKFTPVPVGIKQLNYFRVFNRWGQLMFSTTTMNDGWDGKYAGREQASGVFVWMVEGITKDDHLITKKGTVALIR